MNKRDTCGQLQEARGCARPAEYNSHEEELVNEGMNEEPIHPPLRIEANLLLPTQPLHFTRSLPALPTLPPQVPGS